MNVMTEKVTTRQEYLDEVASYSGAARFIIGEGICMVLAFLYHRYLTGVNSSSTVRHIVAIILGASIGFMTFGSQFLHIIVQSMICYCAILYVPSNLVSVVVFILAMGYLLYIHFVRAFVSEETSYTIEVSGPVMIATQKITSLGFCLSDGALKDGDKMSDLRKKYVVLKRPNPLEYFSYILYFQGILAGPFSFYGDYKAYIEGTNGATEEDSRNADNNNSKKRYRTVPFRCLWPKVVCVLFFMLIQVFVRPLFSFEINIDPEFVRNRGILYKTWFYCFGMFCERSKYYIAFTLGDLIGNISGFGFNGYDSDGKEKWDLLTSIDVLGTEFALSPKEMVDSWNIRTTVWLRHACFDRAYTQQRYLTFVLSAVWHGLYPGYYFTFLLGGVFFRTSGLLRKKVRPYFLNPPLLKKAYDVLTWILTHVAMSYMLGPFILLHLKPTLAFYNSLYWWFHIAMGLISVAMPLIPTPKLQQDSTKTKQT